MAYFATLRNRIWGVTALGLATVGLLRPPAAAATFCVGTVAEQRAALQSTQAAGDDETRIRTGTDLIDATRIHNTTQAGWLVISGGYQEGGGPPSGARSLSAAATLLDGQGQQQIMILACQPPDGTTSGIRVVVENLTFADGVGTGFQRGGGLNASCCRRARSTSFGQRTSCSATTAATSLAARTSRRATVSCASSTACPTPCSPMRRWGL